MTDEDVDAALAGVGPRLRHLRTRRRLTLTEVSERTGISVSTLSRLESGVRRPSLDLLLPLAKAYRVPLDDLVGAPQSGDPRIHPKPVRRDGMIYIPLTRDASGVQAFKLILPPRKDEKRVGQRVHEGYEWIYVLSGTLHLALGDSLTTLTAGEAAEFDTRTPHSIASAGQQPVELIALFSPQGERIHIRDS
ncbi:helix-turn-helix domain-containing protein [Micromonospora sp. 15K316]|uniref:helix-turn-helix domain-containing protein n=1 Tax=Micromonospora sp. 15K316 TaxID=2530376 RepID=UPI0010470939|nr:XRE family transcriptional regulator [Micromonospora sp. 15K316]TDC40034.1 helix-turn-helix domain-containing protein [Micromonospora sp. 15K316]